MKKLLFVFASLSLTSSAQAYKADQQALVIMSDMVAQSVGVELVCGNATINTEFFRQMAVTLEMDDQDLDTVNKLATGKQDAVLGAVDALGKEKWCSRQLSVLTKEKVNGITPMEYSK